MASLGCVLYESAHADVVHHEQYSVLPQDVSVDELKTAISTSEGPVSQATQAEYVKFHDDKVRLQPELCERFAVLLCGAYAIHVKSVRLHQVDSLS